MVRHQLIPICIAGVFILLGSGCGGGRRTAPPPLPALSISTGSLRNGMVTFPYSQAIVATGGVAPFVWSINSGNLPHNVALPSSSANSVTISGIPDTAQLATFTIEVKDSKNRSAVQTYTVNIAATGSVQLQSTAGQAPPGVIEIQGVSAAVFTPAYWQKNTLNWVPDVRMPMFAALPGLFQNVYSPWPLQQSNGWLLFYGGWDGTSTSNDRVYKTFTSDFLNFGSRTLVIDHGAFLHVNNVNVTQLLDGSMHMICTTLIDQLSNDKPAYFSSPDGVTWNGVVEPYAAKLTDVVSIPNDPNYPQWDFNGGNVLLWDKSAWTLYYSVGIYGGIDQIYRGSSGAPPIFNRTGVAANTPHYANDVKQFTVAGKTWYVMTLYTERVSTDPNPPSFSYSLSNDGLQFGPEHMLFGSGSPQDLFLTTPAFVTRNGSILGVLYGANPVDLLSATNQIFARWLQKKVVLRDSSGNEVPLTGGYGPDRQRFAILSSSLQGTIWVYDEDGLTPLASGQVTIAAGQSYQLTVH